MDENRRRAYQFLLCAAMVHLKWDLAFAYGRLSWLNPVRLRRELRALKVASLRAFAFHNLAMFITWNMQHFDEEHFWRDIEMFQRDCPDAANADYPELFERLLVGGHVPIGLPPPNP